MELPVEFREYAVAALGEEVAQGLFDVIGSGEEITSVRVNPFKVDESSVEEGFFPAEVEGKVKWSELGHYLKERPVLLSTLCSMPADIMCRRPAACIWNWP